MRHTNNNSRGRTFWDLIAEHPRMVFAIMVILILAIFFLVWNRYSFKSPVISFEPEKSTPASSNSKVDSIQNSEGNNLDTTALIIKRPVINPKNLKDADQVLIKRPEKDTVKAEVVNVTSHNQQGGITANQVNIGLPPRLLTLSLQNQLLSYLQSKTEPIDITSIMGDSESFKFANEINSFLKSQGYISVGSVAQSVFNKPMVGQFIDRDSSGVKIVIGSQGSQ